MQTCGKKNIKVNIMIYKKVKYVRQNGKSEIN